MIVIAVIGMAVQKGGEKFPCRLQIFYIHGDMLDFQKDHLELRVTGNCFLLPIIPPKAPVVI